MPFPKTEETLERLTREALKHEDIKAHIDGLREDVLIAAVMEEKNAKDIWQAADSDFEALNTAEAQLERAREDFISAVPVFLRWIIAVPEEQAPRRGVVLRVLVVFLHLRLARTRARRLHEAIERIKELALRVRAAHEGVERAVLERGILGFLRDFIGRQLEVSYTLELPALRPEGLAELSDPRYEIATRARKNLSDTMALMECGSIGIAGPRGVGKTTLLRAVSREATANPEEPKVLSVFTAAPVEYQGRDFILHLFASVCRKILELYGLRNEQPPSALVAEMQLESVRTQRRWFRLIGVTTMVVGIFLIGFGLLVARVLTVAKTQPVKQASASTAQQATPDQTSTPAATQASWAKVLEELSIKPGTVVVWGVVFLLFGAVCAFVVGARWETGAAQSDHQPAIRPEGVSAERQLPPVIMAAQTELAEIKYQRSYSSGLTGSFKFPVGIDLGLNSVVTLAKTQLTLPEIVQRYRDFMQWTVAPVYKKIIIAIDEMDKLESDELAHRFVNEIKAIFGLPKCFYLISVSETAISSFERRVNFRDAFDSSFDTMFLVDYLSLGDSELLIRRRVIGVPRSFLCLLHIVSGGLPRDLVREFRSLLAEASSGKRYLPALVKSLVERNLHLKLSAIRTAVKAIKLDPYVSQLLERVRHLETLVLTSVDLLQNCEALWANLPAAQGSDNESDAIAAEREKLVGRIQELGGYLYFLATLMEFFVDRVSEASLEQAFTSGAVEKLARAHQALGVHPRVASAILSEVRASNGMRAIRFLP